MILQLNIEKREVFGKKLKEAREKGKLPVVLYGMKKETASYFVKASDFGKVLKEAGESTVIELKEGDKKVADVLVHDVDIDPVKGQPLHADFLSVDMNKLITASIPLVFEGIPPAEKELSGNLVKVIHELEVEALPNDLPHELKIDTSKLVTFEDRVTPKDIKLPNNVKLLTKEDEVIALVEPKKEETEEELVMDMSQIEVEKKGKQEEEENEASDSKGESAEK